MLGADQLIALILTRDYMRLEMKLILNGENAPPPTTPPTTPPAEVKLYAIYQLDVNEFYSSYNHRFARQPVFRTKSVNRFAPSSLRKQPSFFAPGPSGVSREGRLRFTVENSILMTKICPASGHER